MHFDRSALDSLFSRAAQWPSDGDWHRELRDATEHLIEHLIEHPKTGMLMVLVPAGKFLTSTGGAPIEVDLPAYYVAVHPVTNAQYARFVNETGHRAPNNWFWQESGKSSHPVTNVDFGDATSYCRWAGLRLPIGLEWKKAACGLDGRVFPWGNHWDPTRCRNKENIGGEATASVWSYGKGGAPFGGLQFSGDVWEWCVDHSDENAYARNRRRERPHPSSCSYPVMHGGSWSDDDSDCFSNQDFKDFLHDARSLSCGFRCVSEVSDPP